MPFISLPCLTALARTSSKMLNIGGEGGHPCLVADLRGESMQSFTIKNDISCGFFVDALI